MGHDTTKPSFRVILWAVARHAFVIATGFAALVHSTWTLATIFNGPEPEVRDGHWLAWVAAAFAFAFSIDVGQIAISVELRAGERTRWKYIAFAVLAGLTYFFQWWYVAMHLPDIPLAAGVRPEWRIVATFIRDAALWVVPAALPLATTIYTFSYAKPKIARPAKGANAQTQGAVVPLGWARQGKPVPRPAADFTIEQPEKFVVQCPDCDWRKECDTPRSATNSLIAHRRHRHQAEHVTSNNGRHDE